MGFLNEIQIEDGMHPRTMAEFAAPISQRSYAKGANCLKEHVVVLMSTSRYFLWFWEIIIAASTCFTGVGQHDTQSVNLLMTQLKNNNAATG